MEIDKSLIKFVAIYLRKSREEADSEDVLSKHRDTLLAIASQNNWRYVLYEEIVSGEKIAYRPEMQRLLEDILKGTYDAVLVMDIDRLGRGGNRDWGEIFETLAEGSCYIVTPQKTYDVTEDLDEMMLQFQSLFAGVEYKAIKKRMMRGKVAGAKQGYWTNGKPPYPYIYENKTKQVLVDPEKLKVYRMMISKFLEGMSTMELEHWLNQNRIPTPSGITPTASSGWGNNVIIRILKSEVHLGKVIYGKTKGSRKQSGKVVNKPKSEWIIAEGRHEAIKTQEEHDAILLKLERYKIIPVKSRQGATPLTGLLYCKKCRHRMRLMKNRDGTGADEHWIAVCGYSYKDGTKCEQKGKKLDDAFWRQLYEIITKIDEKMIQEIQQKSQQKNEISALLETKKQQLAKVEQALDKIFQAYEEDDITKPEFNRRKETRNSEKNKLLDEIESLNTKLTSVNRNNVDTLMNIDNFKKTWITASTDKDKNDALKDVIKKVYYDRLPEGDVQLEIEYI